jgi:hypothetical protein
MIIRSLLSLLVTSVVALIALANLGLVHAQFERWVAIAVSMPEYVYGAAWGVQRRQMQQIGPAKVP